MDAGIIFLFFFVYQTGICSGDVPTDAAAAARYVIHETDWLSLGTISTQSGMAGYPFVAPESTSDGPNNNGTGIPYFYMTVFDYPVTDTKADNRVTATATLAQTDYCKNNNYITEDPKCPRVMLTGKLIQLEETDADYEFGKSSLFERHPVMARWPGSHMWKVFKLDIEQIRILHGIGGYKSVTLMEYFNPPE